MINQVRIQVLQLLQRLTDVQNLQIIVEVFTNQQIFDGHAAARGLISPATILNSDRVNVAKFDPNGIGAIK